MDRFSFTQNAQSYRVTTHTAQGARALQIIKLSTDRFSAATQKAGFVLLEVKIERCPMCQSQEFFVSLKDLAEAGDCIACENCETLLHPEHVEVMAPVSPHLSLMCHFAELVECGYETGGDYGEAERIFSERYPGAVLTDSAFAEAKFKMEFDLSLDEFED